MASASATFAPGRALRASGPRTAFLGATLEVARHQRLLLFTGADDGLAVLLDGREVSRRGAVRAVRDDDDLTVLELSPGRHRLVLRSFVRGGEQRAQVRLLDEDFTPPREATVWLEGVDDAACALLAASAARIRTTLSVAAERTRVDVELAYPGGTAVRVGEPLRTLRIAPSDAASARADVSLDGSFAGAVSVWAELDSAVRARAQSPAGDRPVSLSIAPSVRAAIRDASAALAALDERAPPAWLPLGSLWSAQHALERLTSLVAEQDRDADFMAREASALSAMASELRARRDPFASLRGPLRRAYRSDVDGSLQPYSVFVPPSYRGDRRWPVIVALHGLGGSAHRMLPILFGVYDKDEDRTHADRHFDPLPDARALLLAPFAFGDSFYRGVGERDVLRALAELRGAYRVDEDKTYLTGLSMGGIGAASIPLHHPDVFAAAAPLCGYHDYFIRSDTQGPRRAWELSLMEARSNRNWAENGLHLPMYVVQGLRDRPVANSSTFVDRWRELGYAIDAEYPDLGHDVWSSTYAGGRIIDRFLRTVRDPAPSRVRFRTVSTRWARSRWLTVDRIATRGAWAEIDATATGSSLRASTREVDAFTVTPPLAGPFTAVIDGQTAATEARGTVSFERREGRWTPAARVNRDAAVGPIRDAFDGPLLVVYGASSARESALNRRVAAHWARIGSGTRARVRVITDDAYRPDDGAGRTVVLVGTPASHRVLARMQPSLPLRVDGDVIRTHDRALDGALGVTFVAPSPDAADGRVVVVTGTSARGVWRSRFLPDLVPDFVAYDDRVAPARGRVLLGRHARVVCAGFYDRAGRVGPRCEDTVPRSEQSSSPPGATED
jgi:poly(3-hydroxybutyrate) depolymerase